MNNNIIKGINWLNKNKPDWKECIILEELDMSSTTKCVLGQVYKKDYGRVILDPDIPIKEKHMTKYGFDIPDDESISYAGLTLLWLEELRRK